MGLGITDAIGQPGAMADLVYTGITSLDGYIADAQGDFQWAAPDEEVHAFANDLERPVGTHLYGRRMYEVMKVWETLPTDDEPPEMADYAELWRAADKIVYSTTLPDVETSRTRLERTFDPDAVRALKEAATRPLAIAGAGIAAHALAAGLVDELHQLVTPIVVGGGTAWLPDGLRLPLTLVDERRFTSGVVHLHYRVRS
jgi:dihydrofolate reductase